MSDSLTQWILQQSHARSVSGEDLETYGNRSAEKWASGEYKSLNDAVVGEVKHAGFAPEQVRRVVEFANTRAYLAEFRKEGSTHKIIDFQGGPADPAVVLRDLNDGGGGTVFDRGSLDYSREPKSKTASVSAVAERELQEKFAASGPTEYPEVNPLGDFVDLRDKIAGVYQHKTSELSGLEVMFMDLSDLLYGQVKQAALNGYTLGDVLSAWQPVTPDAEYVKVAFAAIAPRLLKEEVFRSPALLGASFEKVATARQLVNLEHPLVSTFQDFCQILYKLAETRESRDEAGAALETANAFLANVDKIKVAGPLDILSQWAGRRTASRAAQAAAEAAAKKPGLVKSVMNAAGAAAPHAEKLVGETMGGGQALGELAHAAVKNSPLLAAAYGAHQLSQTPTGQRVFDSVLGPSQQQPQPPYYGY